MQYITEKKEIQGFLLTQGQEYPLLSLSPNVRASLPYGLKDHCLEFLIVDQSIARPLIVSRSGFAILPMLLPVEVDVQFIMEEKEDEPENSMFEQLTHEMSQP